MTTSAETVQTEEESTEDSKPSETISVAEAKKMAERAVKSRLDREAKQREKAIEAARLEAIEDWRAENGIDDGVLEKLGEGQTVDAQLKQEHRKLTTEAKKTAKAMDALQAKYDALLASNKKAQINDALLREAAGKFVDPQDAVDKLASRFKYDEDEHAVFIVDDTGERSELTVKELVADLLSKKPHLALPEGTMGSGSRVLASATGSDTTKGPKTRGQRLKMLQGLLPNE